MILVLLAVGSASACSSYPGNGNAGGNAVNAKVGNNINAANSVTNSTTASSNSMASTPNCAGFKAQGKVLIAKQTFPFDYEPFKGSCFVTFARKDDMLDEKDVPRGSTFHIYSNGKDVFEFPDAFGGQPACWVEAVAFDDLNGDGQTDVVMAGRCLSAKDSYPTNAIFVNNGRGFTTNDEANAELDEFKTIDQIKTFVKKNIKRFFV